MTNSETLSEWMARMGAPPPNDPITRFADYLGVTPIWLLIAMGAMICGMSAWTWLSNRADRKSQ